MHQLSAPVLSAPVGLGQPNRPFDVRQVQAALNRSLGAVAPAMVDGRLGPRTASLIQLYQRRVASLEKPGVIAPGGPTWRSLQAGSVQIGPPGRATATSQPPSPPAPNAGEAKGLISAQWLHACKVRHAEGWAAVLGDACAQYEINTAQRIAMFLANVFVETSCLSQLVENLNYPPEKLHKLWPQRFPADLAMQLERGAEHPANQVAIAERAYGGRDGNRKEGAGDGWLYRGRGCIQLTCRNNYDAFAKSVGMPLNQLIPWLETPAGAAESAAHFWKVNGCNALADTGDVDAARHKVNKKGLKLDEVGAFYARLLAYAQSAKA